MQVKNIKLTEDFVELVESNREEGDSFMTALRRMIGLEPLKLGQPIKDMGKYIERREDAVRRSKGIPKPGSLKYDWSHFTLWQKIHMPMCMKTGAVKNWRSIDKAIKRHNTNESGKEFSWLEHNGKHYIQRVK